MSFNYKFLKRKLFYKDFSIDNLRKDDVEKLRLWRNSQRKVLRQNKIISKSEQSKYFNNFIKIQTKKKYPEVILFAYRHKDELIGYGGLVYISWQNNRAELSFLLNTDYTHNKKINNFYSMIYFNLAKKFAFKRLRLNRLYTETFQYRRNQIKILENFGFKKEGILRKHNIKNNKPVNVIVHAIIK